MSLRLSRAARFRRSRASFMRPLRRIGVRRSNDDDAPPNSTAAALVVDVAVVVGSVCLVSVNDEFRVDVAVEEEIECNFEIDTVLLLWILVLLRSVGVVVAV